MRQFLWSPKPTNRETNRFPTKKLVQPVQFQKLTRKKSKLTCTKSNLTRTNPNILKIKPNTISHNKGQKEQQKLRTTNNPTEGVTLIKTHFIENIQALDQCTTQSK